MPMELYQGKLLQCCKAYRNTGSAQMLMTYRSRTDRLSFDERMTVVRECQETFAPFFLEMCSLVPRLNDSDLLFCALSAMGFSSVIIAECLTITPDAVRMRKLRFRDKVGADVFEVLFPTPEKRPSGKLKRNISERDEQVTNESCTTTAGALPLPSVSINPLTSKKMKTKMTFGKAIKSCYKQYFTTKGRASRAEFLYFLLFTVLAKAALGYFAAILGIANPTTIPIALKGANSIYYLLIGILLLAVVSFEIPKITVAVRRFHDIERSGGWIWLYFSPLLMFIANLIVLVCKLIRIQDAGFVEMPSSISIDVLVALNCLSSIIPIVFLIWLCKEGTEGPNRYGPDPTVISPEKQVILSPEETV